MQNVILSIWVPFCIFWLFFHQLWKGLQEWDTVQQNQKAGDELYVLLFQIWKREMHKSQ